ncbi:MAG TPA: hypothetical protein VGN17_20435 [Bryobacteraceae bacterium]|jgi:hypothetical protein
MPEHLAPVREYRLDGIEPDNLLGFLALLGLLRALEEAEPSWRPRVRWTGMPLRPHLSLTQNVNRQTLLEAVAHGCQILAESHDFDRADVVFTMTDARDILKQESRSAQPKKRHRADLFSALMSDGAIKEDKDAVKVTPYCTIFGQGHQHFLERLVTVPNGILPKKLAKKPNANLNSPEKLEQALFHPWNRTDPTQSFRWDPLEDRRYALRFDDPSGDDALTVHGANRLASLALALLTAVPIRQRGKIQLAAVGTGSDESSRLCVWWPVWSRPATLEAIVSMLSASGGHPEALIDRPGLGVLRVYRSRRISFGKFMNFTRATAS